LAQEGCFIRVYKSLKGDWFITNCHPYHLRLMYFAKDLFCLLSSRLRSKTLINEFDPMIINQSPF
ncbi:hypothetical protein KJ708_06930, partial [bacterium]|nr:hypothetical protein [bacterium]